MQTARKLYVCFAKSLLLCAVTAFASRSSVAQTTDSTSQLGPQASPQTTTSDVSSSASAEAMQPNLKGPALCSPSHFVQCFRDIAHDQGVPGMKMQGAGPNAGLVVSDVSEALHKVRWTTESRAFEVGLHRFGGCG